MVRPVDPWPEPDLLDVSTFGSGPKSLFLDPRTGEQVTAAEASERMFERQRDGMVRMEDVAKALASAVRASAIPAAKAAKALMGFRKAADAQAFPFLGGSMAPILQEERGGFLVPERIGRILTGEVEPPIYTPLKYREPLPSEEEDWLF